MKEKLNNLDLVPSHLLSSVHQIHLGLVVCVFLLFLTMMVQSPNLIIRMLLPMGRSRTIDLLHEICLDVLLPLLSSTKGLKNDTLQDPTRVLKESTILLLIAITPLPNRPILWADPQDPFHQRHGLPPHLNLIRIINSTPTLHHAINIIIPQCDLRNLPLWVSLVIHHHLILAILGPSIVEVQRGKGLIRQRIRIGRKDLLSWDIPRISRIHHSLVR